MRRTKEENQRRKRGAYVDFEPDGDPVGVGGLSLAHPRRSVGLGAGDGTGEARDRTVSGERRCANGADQFMRLVQRTGRDHR